MIIDADLLPKRPGQAAAEREAAAFNADYPIGTLVNYWRGVREGEPSGQGETYWQATVLGNHTAVAWIVGCRGCIALSHVQVVKEETQR
jgi:hypothetical protein